MIPKISPRIKGIIYASITGILFGFEYLVVAWIFENRIENFSTLSLVSVNFFGAFLIALLVLGWRKKFWKRVFSTVKKNLLPLLSIGITVSLGIFLLFYSVTHSSAGSTSLLERVQLLFIIFLGIIFLGEKLSKQEVIGIVISIIGFLGISVFPTDLTPLVMGTIFLGAFLYALQSFIVKKYVPDVDGLVFSFIRVGIAGSILSIIFLFSEGISAPFPSFFEGSLLASAGFFGAFVSRYFYFEAHNLLPISFLNIFILLEAVVVVLGEMIFFDFVPFSWTKILAGSVILFGLGILAMGKK